MDNLVRVSYENGFPPLTDKQLRELEEAENSAVVYDEDCPPLTEKQLTQMEAIVKERVNRHKLYVA